MCGSNKVTGAKGIHIVSAQADELSLILGKVKTDEKGLAKYGVIKSEKECNPDHGRIENRLNWCLDMTFNEDYKKHRKNHSPENMTVMRRLALNILRQAEKPENKKQDSLSKRMIWFRENRQFRQTVIRLL